VLGLTMAKPQAETARDARRNIPSVDRVLQSAEMAPLLAAHPRELVVHAVRQVLADARANGDEKAVHGSLAIAQQVGESIQSLLDPGPTPVINATGVILHTNLGRAPLSASALAAMERVSRGYSALEYDVEAGERGTRHDLIAAPLRELTGAEDALVVNNNAGAIFLVLSALAAHREVIISRGQLVEIGGGFRIPDVLRQSGASLVEVGTTNRTYLGDYLAAIGEQTAALLRVHTSNFRVLGFVHAVSIGELVQLADERGIRVVDDLGSGCLLPTERFGLSHEPMVQESVSAGADLICFSGDKLLGGPQAGIIVGKAEAIRLLVRHPLLRALRPDKATLAGLAATLAHYLRGEAEREVPVWRMIGASTDELRIRAERIVAAAGHDAKVVETRATVGGGSAPGETLPSRAIAIGAEQTATDLAAALRRRDPPVIARISDGRVLLDMRTVAPNEDQSLVDALTITENGRDTHGVPPVLKGKGAGQRPPLSESS
jgi:L-seryl-tRNA(Ser) seleniumtransferase